MTNQINREALSVALAEERKRVLALVPQFSDDEWRALARDDGWTVHDVAIHVADTTYGLALMLTGQAAAPPMPVDPTTGWFTPHEYNEARRQKNRDLPREKVFSRMNGAFDAAERAIETIQDYHAPITFGPTATTGAVLQRIIDHSAGHRAELEQLLAGTRKDAGAKE